METTEAAVIRQHLIDPEICIRCNTCESTCPVGAITHDARNYVVDANICNLCMACVPPCPTGSIDNWRAMPRARAYSVDAQFEWDSLPAELSADELGGADASAAAGPKGRTAEGATDVVMQAEILSYSRNKGLFAGVSLEGSTLRSDGGANENLYGKKLTAKEIIREGKVAIPPSAQELVTLLDTKSPVNKSDPKSLQ